MNVKSKIDQIFTIGFEYKPLQRINVEEMRQLLVDHPDRNHVNYILDGYTYGFKIGNTRSPDPRPPCKNLREARRHETALRELINKEIALGHMLGPFKEPPLPNLVFSPLNLVPKANSATKFRLVQDLSYPWDGQQSVNACIPSENSSVQYHSFDEVVEMAQKLGKCIFGARLDVEFAFRNQAMHFSVLHLLACSIGDEIYLNSSLPFGLSSSCKIFEKISETLQWIVIHHTTCIFISHFLDDFALLQKTAALLAEFMAEFCELMVRIGMPISHDKTLGPTQHLEYLGLILDFVNQVVGIPEKKRLKCRDLVQRLMNAYKTKSKVTIKYIQKTAGSLNFICQALPAGRPFIASIYRLTRGNDNERRPAGHHRRINLECFQDLTMFDSFLDEAACLTVKTVPFLQKLKIFSDDIELYSDASGSVRGGVGIFYAGDWRRGEWKDTTIFSQHTPNIALLELYGLVLAVEVWAHKLSGKTITLRTDSKSTEGFVNSCKANIPAASDLIRHLTKTCLHFQIVVRALWIEGKKNLNSDDLSRGYMTSFFQRNPRSPRVTPPLPKSLWPPTWTIEQMKTYPRTF